MPQGYQRPYPPEFPREAVSLVKVSGRSLREVAEVGRVARRYASRIAMVDIPPRSGCAATSVTSHEVRTGSTCRGTA